MIQGTTSDAGKSAMVCGLCRVFKRRGIRVAPFKPQNMALNSAVTQNGGEIGRAQAVQAQACGLSPHTDMNPVLIKPNSDINAQIIIHGAAAGNMDAVSYHHYKQQARTAVLESYRRLQQQYQLVLVEGAGSPAEINLRDNDIANMGFAEQADCPVLLVGDIDRGGIFAHLHGTLSLLAASERQRIRGFIINRFRGDLALLQSGLDWLHQESGKPVVGVVPYLHNLHLEAEDSIQQQATAPEGASLRVVVPVLPRISNHTDLDPLRHHPQVDLHYIGPNQEIPAADLIILPGSKNVSADLQWLRNQGWDRAIQRHLRYGGKVIGICGGFQMLGKVIHDPQGLESEHASMTALGFLDMETTLQPEKKLANAAGLLHLGRDIAIHGYEIHMGVSRGPALLHPLMTLAGRDEGAISADNQILGSYLHGLFNAGEACAELLQWAGLKSPEIIDYHAMVETGIDLLADTLEQHLDMGLLDQILDRWQPLYAPENDERILETKIS